VSEPMNRYGLNGGVSGSAGSAPDDGTRELRCNGTNGRSRMSLTVGPELARLIKQAKRESGNATASKAIRWAVKRALTPPPSVLLAFDIVKWANGLMFLSPREQRELRNLVSEMYKQVRQRECD